MEPLVLLLVLLAAASHATWNAFVKAGADKLVSLCLVIFTTSLPALAALPFLPIPAAAAWPYLIVSALVHYLYYAFLVAAYRHGDLSLTYPIARGSAPLLVALGAWLLAGACTALSLCVSCLAGDQLIAFLVSAVLLALLFGLGALARVLPPALAEALHYANPAAHYLESSALGVLDLRDLLYHALAVALGLHLATTAVEARRRRGGAR